MANTPFDIVDLELELIGGGWSLKRQEDILEWMKGKPKRFVSEGSRQIFEEAKDGA